MESTSKEAHVQNLLTNFGMVGGAKLLHLIGGEPLDGSGFEAEQADLTFASNEMPELPAAEPRRRFPW
jgi:hypothetical protein